MHTHDKQALFAGAWDRTTSSIRVTRHRLLTLVARPLTWLGRWRDADAALAQFETMGERELFDIGITRVDVYRVARGASTRDERYDTKACDDAATRRANGNAAASVVQQTRPNECYR
jgi:uncharacterized protein YjiS (DUF1127 family)